MSESVMYRPQTKALLVKVNIDAFIRCVIRQALHRCD